MSVRCAAAGAATCLYGSDGELVQIRITADPKLLEDVLECLADVSFPVNPQIYHGRPTVVEFPAYDARVDEVRKALRAHHLDQVSVRVDSMLAAISA